MILLLYEYFRLRLSMSLQVFPLLMSLWNIPGYKASVFSPDHKWLGTQISGLLQPQGWILCFTVWMSIKVIASVISQKLCDLETRHRALALHFHILAWDRFMDTREIQDRPEEVESLTELHREWERKRGVW